MTRNLFDMSAVQHNRDRAIRAGSPALFLRELVAAQISERLNEVNRRFTSPALVSAFPEVWQDHFDQVTLIDAADVLDIKPGAHDLIIHDLSLHWSDDPVGQMIQCHRGLCPDGLFLGVLFGGRTLHELRTALAEAESSLTGGLSPRVAQMAELRDLGGLLQRAGFALPVADSDIIPVTYADLPALMRDLRAMGEANAQTARLKRFTGKGLMDKAAEIYARHFSDGDNRLCATFEVIYLTGWAPSADQPKPLRPGSAQKRLADELGTREVNPETFDNPEQD